MPLASHAHTELPAWLAELSDLRLGFLLQALKLAPTLPVDRDEMLELLTQALEHVADEQGRGPGVPARWRGAAAELLAEQPATMSTATALQLAEDGAGVRRQLGVVDQDEPLTFEGHFNGGRGGASITINGCTRFVEGRKARDLAAALDLRRDPANVDLQRAALRRGGQP